MREEFGRFIWFHITAEKKNASLAWELDEIQVQCVQIQMYARYFLFSYMQGKRSTYCISSTSSYIYSSSTPYSQSTMEDLEKDGRNEEDDNT